MKPQNRILHNLLSLLAIACLLTVFSSQTFAQGKRVVIGSGSGYLDYPNAQATLNLHDDDTVVINAGKYYYMSFKNITASPGHKIYIINNGLVEFSDPSPSTFSNLTNVEIKGNGTAGIDFGFYIHDVIRAISMDGTLSSVYISYFKMANVRDYAIYLYNPSHVYDGTNNANSLSYDLKFLHFSVSNLSTSFIQAGTFKSIIEEGMISMIRKFEVAYGTIEYVSNQDIMHLNKVVDANIHHIRFSHNGQTNIGHSCMVYLYGNGDIHHNRMNDYWGSGARIHAFSLDAVGAVNVYNNIMVDSKKYSGVEAKATEAEDLASSAYLHYTNFKIYNNTFGNFTATPDWHAAMVDTFDFLGGTIEIKNNIGFNIQRDKPYDPTWNYTYQRLNITFPDTSNNIYNPSYVNLGLIDDTSCLLNVNSPAIDKGLTFALVTDDIDGIARPQGIAFDLGAHEYQTGVIYPVSNAGADTSTLLPKDSITLNGSGSYNPGGGALTYQWTQVSGPSPAVFKNDNTAAPTLTGLLQGSYQVKLTVTNSQGNSREDIVVITVIPVSPPVSNAGTDIGITLPTNSTTLNGTQSSDPAGSVLTYAWSFVSGPASFTITGENTATPQISNLTQGVYQVKLVVTNAQGASAEDAVNITVSPVAAVPPVANAGSDITITLPVNTATPDGSASSNAAGGTLTYAWSRVSGPASFSITGETTARPSISNLSQGVYQVKLIVTNAQGLSAEDAVTITVSAAAAPVANAGGSTLSVILPVNTASLNGSSSYDPSGGALSYSWTETSGPAGATISGNTTATPTISNLKMGNYQVTLTVTNASGVSASDVVNIIVTSSLLSVPNAGKDTTINFPNGYAILNGSGSYGTNGATIAAYHWQQVSGPTTAVIGNRDAVKTTATSLEPGIYIFKLTVTDSYGQNATTTFKVTVVSSTHYYKSINLYPNPCFDRLHIHAVTDSTGSLTIRITNMLGIVMLNQTFQKTQLTFDGQLTVSQLPTGLYLLEVITDDKVQLLGKFVKH